MSIMQVSMRRGGKIRKEAAIPFVFFANGEKLDISHSVRKTKEQAECLSAQE